MTSGTEWAMKGLAWSMDATCPAQTCCPEWLCYPAWFTLQCLGPWKIPSLSDVGLPVSPVPLIKFEMPRLPALANLGSWEGLP